MPIRVLIVDNQSMVRRGLRMFLETDEQLTIVGEASNGREAVDMSLALQPDVILMDLLMPEMDGINSTQTIRQQQPDVSIIALSSSTDYSLITSSILAGVSTYLHKGSKPQQLIAIIKGVTEGRVMLAPDLMKRLLNFLPLPTNTIPLTSVQIALLRRLAAGLGDIEIAQQLQTQVVSVRLIVSQIQTVLSSDSRLLIVLRAMQLGLIELPPPA